MNEKERNLKHLNSRIKKLVKKHRENFEEIQRLELQREELEREIETEIPLPDSEDLDCGIY